jgi:hypothetical protein
MNASAATPLLLTPPPLPDDGLSYSLLPATADDGFPQAFLMSLQSVVYRVTMTVCYPDPALVVGRDDANTLFDLPDPVRGLYLNLMLEFEQQPPPARLIGARRAVLDLPIAFGPLRLRFKRIRIAQANLRGPGAYGSELRAEVAVGNG